MHQVTFILRCALFTPLPDSLLSRYTVVHLLHVRWTRKPRTAQPVEREARGQPWGKGSSTDGNNTNLHDQKHADRTAFAASSPTASQSFSATDTANSVCSLGKEVTPLSEITSIFHTGLNELFRIEATAPKCSSLSICTQAFPSSPL